MRIEDADHHMRFERAPRVGGKQYREFGAIAGGHRGCQPGCGGQGSEVVEPARLEGGKPVVGLHARSEKALVEARHAGAGGLVGQCCDTNHGDKDEQQQEGDDDLLSKGPPGCGVSSDAAERRVHACARCERRRLDARLTHRLPPKRICLLCDRRRNGQRHVTPNAGSVKQKPALFRKITRRCACNYRRRRDRTTSACVTPLPEQVNAGRFQQHAVFDQATVHHAASRGARIIKAMQTRVEDRPSVKALQAKSEVIGSLLRPDYLVEARRRHEQAEISMPEFKRLEDHAVDEAIETQARAGIDVITDGEMRRYAFYGHLIDSLDGFDQFGGWGIEFRDGKGEKTRLRRPVVVEKLRWRHHMCVEEWTYLRARTSHSAKVTLISAQQAAAYYDPEKSRDAYPTRDAYLADIVDFTRREIEELRRLGCTYVQIDAPQVRRPARQRSAGGVPAARQRSGRAAGRVHRDGQRDHRRPPRDDVRDAHLPRQQPEQVLRGRGLRPDRHGAEPDPVRSLFAGVRRRTLG